MASIENASGWGQVVRVKYVEDQRWVWVENTSGQIGWLESPDAADYAPGTILHVLSDRLDEAPEKVWPSNTWISVVRIRQGDVTVVDIGGQPRAVPTSQVEYSVGNTVEVSAEGVIRVLDEKPIRLIDFPEVDDNDVEGFIVRDNNKLTFDSFGGHADVISRARELVEAPLKYGDLLRKIGARSVKGVLFTGGPGTGKTMLARIIAGQAKATFYQISGPEIVSKWHGQSEELLRKIFEHAKKQDSAIIFFDEFDSIAAQRDDDAHEASRRLVAQLLTLMDGFHEVSNVVVIATTNRPQDIDGALLRPGRFDWEIEFPLPEDEDRKAILEASSRILRTAEGLPHGLIAVKTDGWSGADLTAIWTDAALLAAKDGRDIILAEDYFGGFERVEARRLTSGARETKEKR
ncbi:ATP-binding protein [Actinoplanes sp. NPDC051861]|uniref:ATP-binding protein n=1 Tax=Actinoplanes sp. NPDC051861 TaxID=3155170 RepID=UPI0034143FA7